MTGNICLFKLRNKLGDICLIKSRFFVTPYCLPISPPLYSISSSNSHNKHPILDLLWVWSMFCAGQCGVVYLNMILLCVITRHKYCWHPSDVILSAMASQITNLAIVYSISYSGTNQRKHQSSASLAFVRGIHQWPVTFPHKGLVTREKTFDDVIIVV